MSNNPEHKRQIELRERGLPAACYRFEPTVGICVIRRGVSGYAHAGNAPDNLSEEESEAWVKCMNGRMGVTAAQSRAMMIGSMFGWEAPGAFPSAHEPEGQA